MTVHAAPDIEDLVVSARRLKDVKVSWLQTYVGVESYGSYSDAAGVMSIHPKTAYERVDKLERAVGFVISSETFDETTEDENLGFKKLCESLLGILDDASGGRLYRGTDAEREKVRGLSVDTIRTFLLVSTKVKRHEAASQLSVDESTISRRLSDVEEAFGRGALFEQSPTIQLTDAGKEIVRSCKVFLRKFHKHRGKIGIAYVSAEEWSRRRTARDITIVRKCFRFKRLGLEYKLKKINISKRSKEEKAARSEGIQLELAEILKIEAYLKKLALIYPDEVERNRLAANKKLAKELEGIWEKQAPVPV